MRTSWDTWATWPGQWKEAALLFQFLVVHARDGLRHRDEHPQRASTLLSLLRACCLISLLDPTPSLPSRPLRPCSISAVSPMRSSSHGVGSLTCLPREGEDVVTTQTYHLTTAVPQSPPHPRLVLEHQDQRLLFPEDAMVGSTVGPYKSGRSTGSGGREGKASHLPQSPSPQGSSTRDSTHLASAHTFPLKADMKVFVLLHYLAH